MCPIQVVILAGGLGTRLRPLTNNVPKSLVAVNGEPFLGLQLNLLKRHGFRECVICTGHLGQQVEDYISKKGAFGLSIRCSQEPRSLGTAGALKLAERYLGEEFMVINGDTYLDTDYTGFIMQFRAQKLEAMIVASRSAALVKKNLVVSDKGLVLCYNKQMPPQNANCVDAGAIVLHKEALDHIPEGQRTSLEEDVFPELVRNGKLVAYVVGSIFYDIGTLEGISALEQHLGEIK